ncbi:hypothetical protein FVE67_04040 [Thermosulfurimonas marina]|uniref:Uncharacterized protein n=1 Tax=Thermosulfurimonas marina TaxID=2047767 RepID=A0A6H1WS17_9BACT|nr:hypothetical protein [Thermosulfurimonas marina]QJA06017.1 hypothetical protein FVE67_04040 [Thermosulfurimonas marina]
MRKILWVLGCWGLVFLPVLARAVPTRVVVGVKARDALFIGSPMGGAQVIIRDADTGEILAQGVTRGLPGNPKLIMATPKERYTRYLEGKTARFEAVLDLQRPRRVRIVARGPLAQPQALQEVSVTTWLFPGKDLPELVLEMPGLVVRALAPVAHARLKAPARVEVRAAVMPLCGCPVNPKFFWKPENYEVAVQVLRNGRPYGTFPLKFTGKTSLFSTVLELPQKGIYELTLYAYDKLTGNTGVDRTTVVVK